VRFETELVRNHVRRFRRYGVNEYREIFEDHERTIADLKEELDWHRERVAFLQQERVWDDEMKAAKLFEEFEQKVMSHIHDLRSGLGVL
jgi:hypothetical protein